MLIAILSIVVGNFDDYILRNGRVLSPQSPVVLENIDFGWFFIHITKPIDFRKIEALINTTIPTASIINQKWIHLFLTKNQHQILSKHFYLTPVVESDKMYGSSLDENNKKDSSSKNNMNTIPLLEEFPKTSENKDFKDFVNENHELKSSPSYLIHANNEYFNHSNMTEYYTDFYISDKLPDLSDPSILSVEPFNGPELLNRWAVGAIQSEEQFLVYNENSLITNRPIHERGIKGDNVVVTIIDSGVDTRLCYFKDENRKVPFNTDDLDHRKIVRYEALADTTDANAGHGTHVVGTLTGNALCENCSAALYNGHAPNSKIFMVDAGLVQDPTSLVPNLDYMKVLYKAKQFHSKIMSNSWGFPPSKIGFMHLYDTIAYENPDILMVFGAGNTKKMFDMYTPANSKNCLAVGGTSNSYLADLEKNSDDNYVLIHKRKKYKISPAPWSESLFSLLKEDPLPNFRNLIVTHVNLGCSKDKVFIPPISGSICEHIEIAQTYNCSAAIIPNISHVKSLVCTEKKEIKIPIFYADLNVLKLLKSNQKVSIDFKIERSINYSISKFNSGGPSDTGLLKPDLMAPGADIRSAYSSSGEAKKCHASSVLRKYGTSMAVPAISAAAAMILQYFRDGFFPYFLTPSAALMKAMLINCAGPRNKAPDNHAGYGVIHLDTILAFPESNFRILIAEWVPITENTMVSAKFKVKKSGDPLCITLTWDDPPISVESELPLFADLDLILITPNSKTIIDDNVRITSKRIFIPKAERGEYTIQVFCPVLYKENVVIKFAVVASGNFKKSNFLKFQKNVFDRKICYIGKTGYGCEHEVFFLPSSAVLQPRKLTHFMLALPSLNNSTYLLIFVKIPNFGQKQLTQIEISLMQTAKYGGTLIHFEKIKQAESTYTIDRIHFLQNQGGIIYISLFEATEHQTEVTITTSLVSVNQKGTILKINDYKPQQVDYDKIRVKMTYKPAPSKRPRPTTDYKVEDLSDNLDLTSETIKFFVLVIGSLFFLTYSCFSLFETDENDMDLPSCDEEEFSNAFFEEVESSGNPNIELDFI
ncbi:hypothetical protein TRFO_19017 [Tritrichomonas foetus]|uniref:Peptidase S8/S53 domain-containing protein n=1 Tax=Tritrichomonas foetus TaxID=1144522 RepID=A0A1J4KJS8_9EUKA|nr:hypothetical protein TRFO_19017 [Tritrichomonas foetus]|eukprot:OHT11483.1 hypothetical protein TRFO_19017 [Tritrichomonas foetus]